MTLPIRPSPGTPRRTHPSGVARVVRASLLAVFVAFAVATRAADELPSPDAMALGARVVPAPLVQGFRAGIEDEVLDRVLAHASAEQRPALRARARAGLASLLDEAFPPELLAGLGAQFLAAHYTVDELRILRARDESTLGRKLREFDRRAADIVADSPASLARAREALARATFTGAEQRELETFEATPLGKKGLALAPELTAFFVDALDRRWASVRPELEPRLRAAAERQVPAAE